MAENIYLDIAKAYSAAAEKAPGLKSRFAAAGFDPAAVASLADLSRLPAEVIRMISAIGGLNKDLIELTALSIDKGKNCPGRSAVNLPCRTVCHGLTAHNGGSEYAAKTIDRAVPSMMLQCRCAGQKMQGELTFLHSPGLEDKFDARG